MKIHKKGFNMIKIFLGVFLALSVFSGNVYALSAQDVLQNMRRADERVRTKEINFRQVTDYIFTRERQETTGTLRYRRPNLVSIHQHTPEQYVYIDGRNITIYTPAHRQAVIDRWQNVMAANSLPALLINFSQNLQTLTENNTVTLEEPNERNHILKIVPNDPRENFTLRLFVSKETYFPTLAVMQSNAVSVNVQITSYRLNPNIAASEFRFRARPGVDIIQL